MGMAASQARLLSITSRIHDVEYQAQQIQSAKMALALQEDEVYRKYNEALDAQTLTFRSPSGNLVAANFNNLFGVDSIKNGLNADYILYNSDGEVVIPSDIFDAYSDMAGSAEICDPYAFAMSMVSDVTPEELVQKEDVYIQGHIDNDYLKSSKEKLESYFATFLEIAGYETGDTRIEDLSNGIYECNGNIDGIFNQYPPKDNSKQTELNELKKNIKDAYEEFRFVLYSKGKSKIFNLTVGNEDAKLDTEKFNYYLRYAKIIEDQGGINCVQKANDPSENFENDSELFNQMLMAGRLTLDIVSIDKKGNVDYDPTSAASDSNIAYNNESSVDSRALKKAEAEYEHAMKKINKKDKQYDMDLNRLETERTALTSEYDSVKQVIKDNIERTFKIFS